jgi:tetratricopeptide (TPR) repeat protein
MGALPPMKKGELDRMSKIAFADAVKLFEEKMLSEAVEAYNSTATLCQAHDLRLFAKCHWGLAVCFERMGAPEKALQHYASALNAFISFHGAAHADIFQVLMNVGVLHEASGALREALHAFEKAVSIQKQLGGPHSVEVKNSTLAIGRVKLALIRANMPSVGDTSVSVADVLDDYDAARFIRDKLHAEAVERARLAEVENRRRIAEEKRLKAEAERQAKLEAERLVREAKEREEAEWAAIEKKYDEDYAAWVAGGKKKGLEPVKPERKVAAPES